MDARNSSPLRSIYPNNRESQDEVMQAGLEFYWPSPEIHFRNKRNILYNNEISAKKYYEKGVRFRIFELLLSYYNLNK